MSAVPKPNKAKCKAKGCTNAARKYGHGYCQRHYAESREPSMPWPLQPR